MPDPNPRRRWFQYSLRALLVLVLLCSIAASWLAVKMRAARRQREAVEAISAFAHVEYYHEQNAGPDPPRPGPAWARRWLGEDFFAKVRMSRTCRAEYFDLSNEQMEHFAWMPDLAWLQLRGTQVTDRGLEQLAVLSKLKYLNIERLQITDEGIAELQRALPKCKIAH